MECISACSTQNALQFALPPKSSTTIVERWKGRSLEPVAVVAILAALFFGGVGLARATHHWQTNISDDVYRQLIPSVDDDSHPGF
jgi:hypothetical protein